MHGQDTYIQCLFKAVVVIGSEEVVDSLRLVATEQLNVSLHHVRGWSYLLLSLRPKQQSTYCNSYTIHSTVSSYKSNKLWIKDSLKEVELFSWMCLQFVGNLCQVQRKVQQD